MPRWSKDIETFLNNTSRKRQSILDALSEEVYTTIANHEYGNKITLEEASGLLQEKYNSMNMYISIQDAAAILIQTGWYEQRKRSLLKEA